MKCIRQQDSSSKQINELEAKTGSFLTYIQQSIVILELIGPTRYLYT